MTEATDREPSEAKKPGGPIQFFKEVQAEGRKVTWATRQEVTVSTIMVVIMVTLAVVFFWLVDAILSFGVDLLLPQI